jgi:hypothetical protein
MSLGKGKSVLELHRVHARQCFIKSGAGSNSKSYLPGGGAARTDSGAHQPRCTVGPPTCRPESRFLLPTRIVGRRVT